MFTENHICKQSTDITDTLIIRHNEGELSDGKWVVAVVAKHEPVERDDDGIAFKRHAPFYEVSTEVAHWQENQWIGLSGSAMWHSEGVFPQLKISDQLLDLEEMQRQNEAYQVTAAQAIKDLENLQLD